MDKTPQHASSPSLKRFVHPELKKLCKQKTKLVFKAKPKKLHQHLNEPSRKRA
jgi:hypothetical protein